MKRVAIIQRRLTHYRVPLFALLREVLAERCIQLDLLVGKGTLAEEMKSDSGELPWAISLPTRYLAGERLCWQPIRRFLAAADLVIVTQENKLIQNHLLLLAPRRFKLAFWGHGANLQSDNPKGIKERFKRWTTNQVDWWFAYTRLSADLVVAAGFPDDRVTVLNNTLDTDELNRQRQLVTPEETQALRESLGFGAGPTGVFVGSLYVGKRLDFLFAAAEAIRQEIPDFQLLILGEGPERDKVRSWCAAHPWGVWVGARFGREKVEYMLASQVTLNPGGVGLGILDSFVCGVPMITTACGIHGPEIAYLKNGVNGVLTADALGTYVESSVALLRDSRALASMRTECIANGREYTLTNMADRFADGVEHCLQTPRFKRLVC